MKAQQEKEQEETPTTAVEEGVKSFPCKCDHCDWTGTVGDAQVVESKAQCPKCGGSLAANRTQDQIKDTLGDYLNLEETDF